MPDYNPAVALGVQPPQNDLPNTLNTIANLQERNALAGYYNLQELQQQRQYNALQAGAQAYRTTGDAKAAAQAVLDNAGGPDVANAFLTLGAHQTGINAAGGMEPQAREALAGASHQSAEAANARAQLPGFQAESDVKQREDAARAAAAYVANPTDENWQTQIVPHMQQYGGPHGSLAVAQAQNVSDPNQRLAIAKSALAGGMPTQEATRPQGFSPETNVATPLERLSGQSATGPGGGAPNTPQSVQTQKSTAEATVKYLQEDGKKTYDNAQTLMGSMVNVDKDIEQLGPQWMGTGAETKAEAVKGFNSILSQFNIAPIAADKVANWEEFNKEQIRAGMQLINSNFGGSREAASIIKMGKAAVPGVQNSYLGAKYVSATIKAAAQRQIDLYEYQAQHSDQLPAKSAIDFNKANPPQTYAMRGITSVIPNGAKQYLAQHPDSADKFDKNFGPGTAEFLLGQ